jgi:GT2 family glycosyltransferase
MSARPQVTAVVVDWNGATFTRACVVALAAIREPALQTIVVDNGSADPDALRALEAPPAVRVLRLARNLGFAGGSNAGIRVACAEGADWIWLLNNDAEPHPDALSAMVTAGESDPRVGAVGCVLDEGGAGGPATIHGGGRVSFWSGLPRHHARRVPIAHVDYLRGASLLVRRRALAATGLLDEGFFLYWEDADLCFRLRAHGFALAVCEDAVVRHAGHGSLAFRSPEWDRHFTCSSVRFFRRHAALPAWPIAVSAGGRLVRRLAVGRWANARAVWDGLRAGIAAGAPLGLLPPRAAT